MAINKSKSASSTNAPTTTTYNTTDQRVGVDGQGNIGVGAGASVSIVNNDLSADIAKAAIAAADSSSQAATDASVADTKTLAAAFSSLSQGQVELLGHVIDVNAQTTDATRTENSRLAQDLTEKSINAISDNKTSADQVIVTTGIKYISYAAVAVSLAVGAVIIFRKK